MGNLTLELAEAAFCSWRGERVSRAESIPENLWVMALALYPQYKLSKICHRLRLSGGHFKRRLEGIPPAFSDNGFVLASRDDVKVNSQPSANIQLVIQGKERALTLCVSLHMLGEILPHIVALL